MDTFSTFNASCQLQTIWFLFLKILWSSFPSPLIRNGIRVVYTARSAAVSPFVTAHWPARSYLETNTSSERLALLRWALWTKTSRRVPFEVMAVRLDSPQIGCSFDLDRQTIRPVLFSLNLVNGRSSSTASSFFVRRFDLIFTETANLIRYGLN